jgi:predicted RNase H-like nuclease (RuvC/YqgF family)
MTKSYEAAHEEVEVLKDDLRKSKMGLAKQEGLVAELGAESMSMKEAMSTMKQQAMEMAVAAQQAANTAAEELAEANGTVEALRTELQNERTLKRYSLSPFLDSLSRLFWTLPHVAGLAG